MHRKLILLAVMGIFVMATATHGLAANEESGDKSVPWGTDDWMKQEYEAKGSTESTSSAHREPGVIPAADSQAGGENTQNFGTGTDDWLNQQNEARGTKAGTSRAHKERNSMDGNWKKIETKKVQHGMYRYDSRDPDNSKILPGGRIVKTSK